MYENLKRFTDGNFQCPCRKIQETLLATKVKVSVAMIIYSETVTTCIMKLVIVLSSVRNRTLDIIRLMDIVKPLI